MSTDEKMIAVLGEDAALVQDAMAEVVAAQNALGAELERHLNTVGDLKMTVDAARSGYRALVEMLSRKYVKRPGSYDFRPEISAFVAREE